MNPRERFRTSQRVANAMSNMATDIAEYRVSSLHRASMTPMEISEAVADAQELAKLAEREYLDGRDREEIE